MEFLGDTTFLIDLQRQNPEALSFLKNNPDAVFQISVISVGELVPGFFAKGRAVLTKILEPFPVIEIDDDIA